MAMRSLRHLFVPTVCAILMAATGPIAASTFRAGAARIDITPPEGTEVGLSGYGGRTENFRGVHDRLYYRAIVVDDGRSRAAIIVGDVINIGHEFWRTVTQRIESETGIPAGHILLAATHTHGAPAAEYRESEPVVEKILQAVEQARASLQPARIGAAAGVCRVNMNRRARTAIENVRWLGKNPDGPSDKTVHVVRFESLDGRPIAILANYGVHGTVMGPRNPQITGDLPGACSRYVERHYGEGVVSPWTSGTAGDQDPIYRTMDDFGGRIPYVEALGHTLGEEVVRIAERIETTPDARIRAAQTVVHCPGRRMVGDRNWREDGRYEFEEAEPVPVRLSLLMIDHIALCGVSGEVLTRIGLRLKDASPLKHTLMVTNCNGSSGYLPDDASYKAVSYEIQVARVQPGAEDLIVNGLLGLIHSQ